MTTNIMTQELLSERDRINLGERKYSNALIRALKHNIHKSI